MAWSAARRCARSGNTKDDGHQNHSKDPASIRFPPRTRVTRYDTEKRRRRRRCGTAPRFGVNRLHTKHAGRFEARRTDEERTRSQIEAATVANGSKENKKRNKAIEMRKEGEREKKNKGKEGATKLSASGNYGTPLGVYIVSERGAHGPGAFRSDVCVIPAAAPLRSDHEMIPARRNKSRVPPFVFLSSFLSCRVGI